MARWARLSIHCKATGSAHSIVRDLKKAPRGKTNNQRGSEKREKEKNMRVRVVCWPGPFSTKSQVVCEVLMLVISSFLLLFMSLSVLLQESTERYACFTSRHYTNF